MARKLRIECAGAIYHVMNRGERQEPIFEDESDRERFLETLREACLKTDCQVHAYCLMSNHFHLVLPGAGNTPGQSGGWNAVVPQHLTPRGSTGGIGGSATLCSGCYKWLIVDGGGTGYLRTVCEYVHLNPVRAKLLTPEQPLRDYRWSSFGE